MFRAILLSAGSAGLLAALVLTLLQQFAITPLILQAEAFEQTVPAAPEHHPDAHHHADGDHHHGEEWKPDDGWQRTLFTLASNIVMGVGYALLLTGVYTLWRRPDGIGQGLLFGLGGFATFFLAPGLGLPPELPGTEAPPVGTRQIWWIGTALATGVGLALLVTGKSWLWRLLGVGSLIAPHLIGAPRLTHDMHDASTLLTQFRVATATGNAVFWLLLGAASALALQKFSRS